MMNEKELKAKLALFAQDKFRPNAEIPTLIPVMLAHIGSTDPHLRDELIYTAFAVWILDHNAVSSEQMRAMLQAILSEQQIFYHIGEQVTDTVFRRSFSVLLLPLLLIAHRAHPFLTRAEIVQVKEKLISYLAAEKDQRGFVAEKGWAHAIAHTADALDDLVQCPEFVAADLSEVLAAIRTAMCTPDTSLTHEEDERMVTAVIASIKQDLLPDAEMVAWIESFAQHVADAPPPPQTMIVGTNAKNFLQALYFRLRWEQMAARFSVTIEQTLRKMNGYVSDDGE